MYQELEMYKEYKKEKTKIKFNHEQSASLYAIAFFVLMIVVLTFVN